MSALALGASTAPASLRVLVLCTALSPPQLTSVLTSLKDSSKKAGSHKTRELLWKAYGDMLTWAGGGDGTIDAFLMFKAGEDVNEGKLQIQELTKRQRGCCGSLDILGRKHTPAGEEEGKCRGWAMVWTEDEASSAFEDLLDGEPCIYCTGDKVYVGTRYKRVMCKGISSVKTVKDVDALVPTLLPDNPLRSVSFTSNSPPSINSYNFILAGPWTSKFGEDSENCCSATSTDAVYDCFLACKASSLMADANKLIAQMITDVEKGLTACIYAASMKEAGVARRNALMKKVYVHESKAKFIQGAKEDGGIEVNVVNGNIEGSKFSEFGGIVFEIHYRTDLAMFG
ncbi:hypothetical protein TrST_g9561 [Triparma strigata]|uniref:FACT complex subunit n=1 Tax=Triparma strigata TaxID=1606541 RepID=A0A9W7A3U0_9STRA|nr:hypothetical protein TrST_g9561 [Triparma strigata]